ncbi:MAG TPA: transposase [Thermoanaerobaculia bacterium]|nr:transposase [Thermoanaerobaculia bacterium]
MSLERLHLDGPLACYRHKKAASSRGEHFDPRDLLARLLMHITAPRLHLVRYYGRYSNVARARRGSSPPATHGVGVHNTELPGAEGHHAEPPGDSASTSNRRRLRRQWAQLIRRIYEADPLLCTCGATLRILSFLTDPSVVEKILDHLERTLRASGRDAPALDADSHSRAS